MQPMNLKTTNKKMPMTRKKVRTDRRKATRKTIETRDLQDSFDPFLTLLPSTKIN